MKFKTRTLKPWRRAVIATALAAGVVGTAAAPADAAGPRPLFQLPHQCGTTWTVTTYSAHDHTDSLDTGQWDANGKNMSAGQPVLASAAGTIKTSELDTDGSPDYGYYVEIDHGGGWMTRYAHLQQQSSLPVGTPVAQGEQIGRVGQTGGANGVDHLHYTQFRDGSPVRAEFNGTPVDSWSGDMTTWGKWGTDDAEEVLSQNCPMDTFARLDAGGRSYHVAYRPSTGEVDVDRLATDGKGVTTMWEGTWSKGWTHLMPFKLGTNAYVVLYKAATGQAKFMRLNAGGISLTTVGSTYWDRDWTSFTPFAIGGKPHFIAYNSMTGGATMAKVRSDGSGAANVWSGNWGRGWTHLMPFTMGGKPHLLAYGGGSGAIEIDRVNADTSLTELWAGKRAPGLSHFVALEHNGAPHVLAYQGTTGLASFEKVRAGGLGTQVLGTTSWARGWTTFSPFAVNGAAHFMAYNGASGRVHVDRMNTAGSGSSIIWTSGWKTGWS